MTVLLLRLAGPLQSWGASSRFVRRTTEPQPTKSGVIGLLAAALGRHRTDPIDDLAGLRFGVRSDQPGTLLSDFHTTHSLDGAHAFPLSRRYYLSDGAFVAAMGGPAPLLEGLDAALRSPVFPLYLGRRACPPTGPVSLGLRDGAVYEVLAAEPWHASSGRQRSHHAPHTVLEVLFDGEQDADDGETVRDVPVSFDPRRRQYTWRTVVRDQVEVVNPGYRDNTVSRGGRFAVRHEPLDVLGGL